ncbi:MAG: glycosyltransferase family 39 protein [Candidatus Nitrosocaldus sp.]
MNILVGRRLKEQGFVNFLKNYHKPTLYKFKKRPELYQKLINYDNKFHLGYKKRLDIIEKEPPDVTLSDNREGTEAINWRIGKHSPFWFGIIWFIDSITGENYFFKVVIPANIIAILYLVSVYRFVGLFYRDDEYKDKLFIPFIFLLSPAFLTQASQTTNDLALGILVIWLFLLLLKNNEHRITYKDLLSGFLYSIAVLCKFTSLALIPIIVLFYLIRFKRYGISKLLIFFLCFSILPLLLYITFNYDIILNILTGSIEEFTLKSRVIKGKSIIETFLWYVFLEIYNFGIPIVLLLILHILRIRKYITQNEMLTTCLLAGYFLVLPYFFWGGGVSRHWLGFAPLIVSALTYIYKNSVVKNKVFLSTIILLLINNLLYLIHEGLIMAGYYQKHLKIMYW